MEEITVTVRFAETDALGHVNNSSYFIYLEEARIRFFEALGQEAGTGGKDWNFVLASIKLDFINQAYFDQILAIRTSVVRIGTKSFELGHEISCKQTGQTIAKGNSVVVCFDFQQQKTMALPEAFKEELGKNVVTIN